MEVKAGDVVTPLEFVQALRMANPMFDETDNSGHHKQQDSEEFMSFMLNQLKNGGIKTEVDGKDVNLVDKLFKIEMETTLQN